MIRMPRRLVLVAALLSAAVPAFGAGPSLSHFAHLMAEAAVGENAPELTTDFAAEISAGDLPLQFEQTTLKDIQAKFGGDTHSTPEATQTVSWVCYTRAGKASGKPPVTLWFISQNPSLTLNMLVAQQVNAASHDGCAPAPDHLTLDATGLQPLGVRAEALKARFGSLPYDKVRNVYYDSTRPMGDGSGKSIYQRLGYALKNGRAVAIAVSQSTN